VAASNGQTFGVTEDHKVLAVGYNKNKQCDVSDWTDIAIVYAGDFHTVGLKADGTVVAAGYNNHKQCDVSDWTDIIQISLCDAHTVGLKADGTVVSKDASNKTFRVTTQSGRGKGDAFRTGFAAVTGNLIVMLDADGSADPAEIPAFVAALEAGADFAKGSRYLDGGGSADITWTRKLGNTCLSGTANLLHGTHFTDLCYGYNAFWARCLPFIALDVPGFEVETLINLRIAGAGMKITEVPSYEEERIHGESNLRTFQDGRRVLRAMMRTRASPFWRRKPLTS
jgi:glycosyltransferase involved in cell wall biosynthesis